MGRQTRRRREGENGGEGGLRQGKGYCVGVEKYTIVRGSTEGKRSDNVSYWKYMHIYVTGDKGLLYTKEVAYTVVLDINFSPQMSLRR